jgi:hypothetical protein
MKKTLLATTIAIGLTTPAYPAEINLTFERVPSPPFSTTANVTITGEIEKGDDKKFNEVTKNLSRYGTYVVLSSLGGDLTAGLNIGLKVSRSKWSTWINPDDTCTSVCGLIWLAGYTRNAGLSSKVGFHSAYYLTTTHCWFFFTCDKPETSGPGNALVGSYLRDLGFGYNTIRYLTEASPEDMKWLTLDLANKYKIDFYPIYNRKFDPTTWRPDPRSL